MRLFMFLVVTTLSTCPCTAEVGSAPKYGQSDNLEAARLAKVKPGTKYFLYDEVKDGCPSPADRCKRKGYLVPGDIVVATEVTGDFTSVDYVSPKGVNSHGAVYKSALEVLSEPVPSLSAWVGRWKRDSEAQIKISLDQRDGQLNAQGSALWGTADPARVKRGSVHTGELSGKFKPQGEWAGILGEDSDSAGANHILRIEWAHHFPYNGPDGFDCRVRLRLLGSYLLVYDDGNRCGGLNVSFTGLYQRY